MTLQTSEAKTKAAALMPALIDDLKRLAAIPSCAFEGFPPEPVLEMANETVAFLKRHGATNARLIEVPDGYPAVYATVKAADEDAPTVLLYAHYDVQPTPPDQIWDTDPWTATEKNGRIYARGIADDKSGIVMHAGVLQTLGDKPPCNIIILIEGEEETGNAHLSDWVEANPQYVQCDAFIIADGGNMESGKPGLTTALRGAVACKVTVSTLDRALHSGEFGGAIPDALVTLTKLLATLHDDNGDTIVDGLTRFEWEGYEIEESQLRKDAGMLDGTRFVGNGSLASRLWSHPSVTIIGMDVPPIQGTPNALHPDVSAKLSLRIAPGADPRRELDALRQHLEKNVAWGAHISVEDLESGAPYLMPEDNPIALVALDAMSDAWDSPAVRIGQGGSIPLVAVLQSVCPQAGVLITGAEDTAESRIHSSNESVDPKEIERCVVAEALFIDRLATKK